MNLPIGIRIRRIWRTIRGQFADRPVHPAMWLATLCHIESLPGESSCVPAIRIRITPRHDVNDTVDGLYVRAYGPFTHYDAAKTDLIAMCCWAYIAEFPQIGTPV